MGNAFHLVGKTVSTLLGVAMVCFGGIWILQGLKLAFLVGPMVGDRQWVLWGAILAVAGVGQVAWSLTRRR